MITDKERQVLISIIGQPSTINSDDIDIRKSFEENSKGWECERYFWTAVEYEAYGCGLDKHSFAGVVGSLEKKGLATCYFDQWWGGSCRELLIDEKNFNNIVKVMQG